MRGEDGVVDPELVQQRYPRLLVVSLSTYRRRKKDEGTDPYGTERLQAEDGNRRPLHQIGPGNLMHVVLHVHGEQGCRVPLGVAGVAVVDLVA